MTDWNNNWHPEENNGYTVKPTVKATKFGDGYEQRTPIGVNTQPKIWNLKYTFANPTGKTGLPSGTDANEFLAFLQERGGVTSFTWTDPRNKTGKYVCREWEESSPKMGIVTISVKFEQVFDANNR